MPGRGTGFRFLYRVEKTEYKGFGVFASERIDKGSVVWRHIPGIFEVFDERSFRAKIERMSPDDVVYELTHVHAFKDFPGCLIRALDDGIFINHSKTPNLITNNCTPQNSVVDVNSQQYLRYVANMLGDDRYSLVATRDIGIGEELTNDYTAEDACPPYYDLLYEQYGVHEGYLDDR